jgi:sterol desaturase/sphingolipid hydroxylase (fatty acid hydroxylase superfamily)
MKTRFPTLRRVLSFAAVAVGGLSFASFWFLAHGWQLAAIATGLVAWMLALGFGTTIAAAQAPNDGPDQTEKVSLSFVGRLLRFIGSFCLLHWLITLPEFSPFLQRMLHGGGLLDMRLIVGAAAYSILLTLALRNLVSRITDEEIYCYLSSTRQIRRAVQ